MNNDLHDFEQVYEASNFKKAWNLRHHCSRSCGETRIDRDSIAKAVIYAFADSLAGDSATRSRPAFFNLNRPSGSLSWSPKIE